MLALLAAVGIAGCGAPQMLGTHIGGDLAASDAGYPVRNRQPNRTIEITGLATTTFQLTMTAHYLTNGAALCNSSPTFIAGAVEGVKSPSSVSIPMTLVRTGQTYSANVDVDAFAPGRCDWQFGYVTADLSKAGLISLPNLITRARDGWNTPFVQTPTANSSDAPIILHCGFQQMAKDGPSVKRNACVSPRARISTDKREHFYSAATKHVVANFIDDDVTR